MRVDLMNRISVFIKESYRPPQPLLLHEDSEKSVVCSWKSNFTTPDNADTLILDF